LLLNKKTLMASNIPSAPKPLAHNIEQIATIIKSAVSKHVTDDPVRSYNLPDRCGPNPNPEFCYLQKTNACKQFYSQSCIMK